MHVLAYTSPAKGHLFPLIPVLGELRARGHRVSLCTLATEADLVEREGFEFHAIDPVVERMETESWEATGGRGELRAAVRNFAERAALDAIDLAAFIDGARPDVVLVDSNAYGAAAATERWGGPWAMYCPNPLALRSQGVPPFGPGLAPAAGPAGRLRDAVLYPALDFGTRVVLWPGLNRVRVGLGLNPVGRTDDVLASPPLLLCMTAPPFEYERPDLPEHVEMVGPCIWDPPSDPPAWLDDVDRPLAVVTTATLIQSDESLVVTALEALQSEDLFVVAAVPGRDPDQFEVPANARVERFLPLPPLLERAAVVINQGGMGVTQKALAAGVPVCAVPFGRDQFEVARRVEVARAGSRLSARRLNPERLRNAARAAMGMREGAARVAAGYAASGGPGRAASAIEGLLRPAAPA